MTTDMIMDKYTKYTDQWVRICGNEMETIFLLEDGRFVKTRLVGDHKTFFQLSEISQEEAERLIGHVIGNPAAHFNRHKVNGGIRKI